MSDGAEHSADSQQAVWLASLRQNLLSPVSAIVDLNDLLQSEGVGPEQEELASDLGRISQATTQLKAQVDRLLDPEVAVKLKAAGDEGVRRLRHDLRTPINAIKGYSEMLLEDLDDLNAHAMEVDLQGLLNQSATLLSRIDELASLREDAPATLDSLPETAAMFAKLAKSMEPAGPIRQNTSLTGRILVVDDIDANRDLLARRLERDGHQVLNADGGYAALELMSRQTFDLVLLDLMMPDLNGFDVLTRMKEQEALHDIPVIMISALDEIESVARCIEAGAEDYLPKPFDPILLQARINAALEKRRWREQERQYLEQVEAERQKNQDLLHSILPSQIVARLNDGETTIADRHAEVTVLFSDIVGFTELSANTSPARVVNVLNKMFSHFDRIAKDLGVEKIKTIGDAYMVAAGVPDARADHAEVIVEMALRMVSEVEALNECGELPLQIRIGVDSGPVVAGIVGSHRFLYDVWGDTVNFASRMEATSVPGCVQVSEETARRIEHRFDLSGPMDVRVKGKGVVRTHYVIAPEPSAD